MIRALAAEPDIILLDEPFSALDPISREQLQDELVRIQQELRKTIVFVTHDMDEAIKIADTIVLMKDGEIVQRGTPEQILRHPANDFVKSFIGLQRLQQDTPETHLTVDDVMALHPVTAHPNRGLAESLKIMQKHRVDSLVIVDKSSELLGHVSIFQLLARFREENITLKDLMKPFEHVVPTGTPLPVALGLMNDFQMPYVPVVRDGNRFVGLVTKGSIVRHLADIYTPAEEESVPEAEGEAMRE
ncbi:CBS domain-containing protein [Paenibacillus sp. P26]|nr:CBS domain-containing protein [Paenibacillus sp. P26]